MQTRRSPHPRALFLAASIMLVPLHGQVVINEVMSSNRTAGADEDGDFEDWIELKNTGAAAVDLTGYGLTDDPSQPFKWTLPARSIAAGDRLVVWASGKDRTGIAPPPGLLREVYLDVTGGSVESLEWSGNYPGFPDSTGIITDRFDVPRDVGDNYGQRVSGWLTPTVSGNYEFWISADNGSRLYLSTGSDPAKARAIAAVPADRWSNPETYTTYASQRSAVIPLVAGTSYYMSAVMKEDVGGDHLTVQWRRDGNNATREIIPASRFVTKAAALHANFKIGAGGEPVQLTRPDGTVADQIPAAALPSDVSFGRPASAPGTLAYFSQSTRGGENTTPAFAEILAEKPVFSVSGGFHESGFPLSLNGAPAGTTLIYTLDGSIPDPANIGGKTYSYKNTYPNGSLLGSSYATLAYTAPIPISDRSGQPNKISQRTTTFGTSSGYAPTGPVFKGTVVRARLIKTGALPGPVVTHTYFVGPGASARYQLPVISLSINEDDLFDYSKGLYTAGEDYDQWRAYADNDGNGGSPANYKRRSEEWEYPANFELFDPQQGRVLSQNLGFRMHGGWSRAWPQKSLRFYAGEEYDDQGATLNYPLIPGLKGRGTGQPITSFSRFALRNSGNDHELTRLRDAFIQELCDPLDIDRQGYQPAVHFINGEYWGLINIRERVDRYFIASHHGVDPDKVAILSNNVEISEGGAADRNDFIALRNYIASNNMADPVHYAYVAARMDLENFIRYNVAQIYANNRDWPHNNIDTWRVTLPGGPTAGGGGSDGRWRWVIFDTDFGFNLNGGPTTNTLEHAVRLAGSQDWSTVKLRKLLDNPGFRNKFINTFADHMATSFKPARVNSLADGMRAKISANFTEHGARWRNLGDTSVSSIKSFGNDRPANVRSHLTARFGLGAAAVVTLDTVNSSHGSVAINGMVIDAGTPGLSNPALPYPWSGTYFQGVPVTITARPAAGFQFAGWQELPGVSSAEVTLMPGVTPKLTALFAPAPPATLVHYWNFNEPGSQFDPTLSLAAGAAITVNPATLTEIQSGTGQNFTGENARDGDLAGAHFRLNFPIGAELRLALPTTGYDQINLRYETRRSGQGAGLQTLEYSLDGIQYLPYQAIAVTEAPVVHHFDFSAIPGVNDNPAFRVRITFSAGGGGLEGNNRFDNLTLDGHALPQVNQPPAPVVAKRFVHAVEGSQTFSISMADWFTDPNNDPLTASITVQGVEMGNAVANGQNLAISGIRRGEAVVSVVANDGELDSAPLTLVLLVHPAAHALADGDFTFGAWSAGEPEFSYPPHVLFLQSEVDDPGIAESLDRAYQVGTDHNVTDSAGFPYNNAQRTRINGLGPDGISWINTGRGRDLGGLVLALDTTGVTSSKIAFTTETRVLNLRDYAVRLQYRIGHEGTFSDVLQNGQPVVYLKGTVAGEETLHAGIDLPPAALGQPYVQLMWRYYHLPGVTGSRPEIRLDDIAVSAANPRFERWRKEQFTDPADLANPAISGPSGDPSGHGVSNLMRYALGLGAMDAVAGHMPRLVNQGGFRFLFPFDEAKEDLIYRVEASVNLVAWDEVLFDSSLPGDFVTEDGWLVLDDLDTRPAASPTDFFRLKVALDDGH